VTVSRTQRHSSQTDQQGHTKFLNLSAGRYQIRATFVGYGTKDTTILLDADKQITLQLFPSSIRTEEVLVTATRAGDNAATTYKNLSKEDIRRNNLGQDIPYLLDQTPSVVIGSDAGAGIGYTNMTIRGSDNQRINVTLNGIPLNDAESMGSFFVNLPD